MANPHSKSYAPLLIMSAIDLLIAALAAAIGLMLLFSGSSASVRSDGGTAAGEAASAIILDIHILGSGGINCEGASQTFPSRDGTRNTTFLFRGSTNRIRCQRQSGAGAAAFDTRFTLQDGTPIHYRFRCAPQEIGILNVDARTQQIKDAAVRVGPGSCSATVIKDAQ